MQEDLNPFCPPFQFSFFSFCYVKFIRTFKDKTKLFSYANANTHNAKTQINKQINHGLRIY